MARRKRLCTHQGGASGQFCYDSVDWRRAFARNMAANCPHWLRQQAPRAQYSCADFVLGFDGLGWIVFGMGWMKLFNPSYFLQPSPTRGGSSRCNTSVLLTNAGGERPQASLKAQKSHFFTTMRWEPLHFSHPTNLFSFNLHISVKSKLGTIFEIA